MKNEVAVPLVTSMPKVNVTDDAIAGGSAGLVARMLTAPFDVIKIRFQLQGPGEAKYKSMLQAFRTVIEEEGILALWKGNLSATILWVTYMSVQFTIYGVLKRLGEKVPNPFEGNRLKNDKRSSKLTLGDSRGDRMWKGMMLFLAGAGAGW